MFDDESEKTGIFFETAINGLIHSSNPALVKVMDFGCGKGQLVHTLSRLGFDAYGCDVKDYWSGGTILTSNRLGMITKNPYRLPFGDNTFDVVVSTGVLEHAKNKEDCFREILRVLRPGGFSMHLFPGKWYLPYEPHIFVPLVNYLWPNCPKWWFGLWALLGVRNEFQKNQSWQAVTSANYRYCQEGLSYWTSLQYKRLSLKIFGNCRWPMRFYIENSSGGVARILRRLPFKSFFGSLLKEVRMGFMVQQKTV